jgi:L-threonylcarbamoyladenylate synthase
MISNDLNEAKKILEADGIIGLPTETVYGLAANIFSESAIKRIYEVKKRPLFNPLIVHIKGIEQLELMACNIPSKAYQLAEVFWPGPLTLVLQKQSQIPDWITSGKQSVALRVPAHPLALALLQMLNFPLAAPSANPFSTISPTSAAHVEYYFNDLLPLILDGGECQKGIESTIIGFEDEVPVLYRHGSLPLEEIERLIGPVTIKNRNNVAPEAPGMLSKHYSPKTRLVLVEDLANALKKHEGKKLGVLSFGSTPNYKEVTCAEYLSVQADMEEAANQLYAALHRLDQANLDLIIAERLPDIGLGRSINDRLERAAQS